jgi:hypothetical protein
MGICTPDGVEIIDFSENQNSYNRGAFSDLAEQFSMMSRFESTQGGEKPSRSAGSQKPALIIGDSSPIRNRRQPNRGDDEVFNVAPALPQKIQLSRVQKS